MTAIESSNPPARRPALGDLLWMAAFGALVFGMVLALAVAMVPAAELPAGAKPPAVQGVAPVTDTKLLFVVQTGNRIYPDWKEEHRVHIGEKFILGDTKNEAVLVGLYPDFRIVDGKVLSASDSLHNPAVRVFVRREGAVVDSSWAFLNFPPHFSAKSFFTFQLKDIQGWTGPGAPPAMATAGAAAPQTATNAAAPAAAKSKPAPAGKPE